MIRLISATPSPFARAEHPELVGYAEALFARPSFAATRPTPQIVRDAVV